MRRTARRIPLPCRRGATLLATALALLLALALPSPVGAEPRDTASNPPVQGPVIPNPWEPSGDSQGSVPPNPWEQSDASGGSSALQTAGDEALASARAVDPMSSLDGASPLCTRSVGADTARNCSVSHSIARPYPLDNYGLDEYVDWGLTHLGNTFDRITQWIVVNLWQLALYAVNGVLLMLEWAFSIDLLNGSMSDLANALQTMRDTVIAPWGLAAVAVLGLWGIWNGLLRRKTIDTLRGLALSLTWMVAVLVLIGNPAGTLGALTGGVDDASKEMVSSISRGTVSQPDEGVASAERGVFDTIVLGPWCALEFGDVKFCKSQPGIPQSVADIWLEGGPPNSPWREWLYNTMVARPQDAWLLNIGDMPPEARVDQRWRLLQSQPQHVAMMGADATGARIGLLLLILAGEIGAICLFTYLAAQLVMAAVLVLIFSLFSPGMFLVAAFGEAGRERCADWLERWLAVIVRKLVYALFLAIAIRGSDFVTQLNLGFTATWLVFIAYWWGLLLKRDELIGLLSIQRHADRGDMLGRLYHGMRLAGAAARTGRGLARGVSAPARAVGRTAYRHNRRRRETGRIAESEVARGMAREELEQTAHGALAQERAAEHAREVAAAQPRLQAMEHHRAGIARADAELATLSEQRGRLARNGGAGGRRLAGSKRSQEALAQTDARIAAVRQTRSEHAARLEGLSADPGHGHGGPPQKPRKVSDRDTRAWIAKRRDELAKGAGSDGNLRAAGIDPEQHRRAGGDVQQWNLARSQQRMDRDRVLLDRGGDGRRDAQTPLRYRERRRVRKEAEWGGRKDEYAARVKEQRPVARDRVRAERRRRRYVW